MIWVNQLKIKYCKNISIEPSKKSFHAKFVICKINPHKNLSAKNKYEKNSYLESMVSLSGKPMKRVGDGWTFSQASINGVNFVNLQKVK